MKSNNYICIRPLNIILLWAVMALFSCDKEYMLEEKISPQTVPSRSFSIFSYLTEFFNSSCEEMRPIISTLKNINKEKNFIGTFLQKYGIPLWNHTYIIKDEDEISFFVPLYQGNTSIDALWFFHIAEGRMTYAPFRRTDERIEDNEQCFIFDLLSYQVFGETETNKYIFQEKRTDSRAYIELQACWDVYSGSGDDLEYQYSFCVSNVYWIDETRYWIAYNPGKGDGGGSSVISGGGSSGNNSGSNVSASAKNIFKNESYSENEWNLANHLLEDILEDCFGETLFNKIKGKLGGEKVTFRFVEHGGSSYNWYSNTLNIDVNQLESDVFLHEMFHIYQTLSESKSSFEGALLNREIEAHYAQYLYNKRQSSLLGTNSKYGKNQRLHSCILMNRFIDDYGNFIDETLWDNFESMLCGNIAGAFREDGYENCPFNYDTTRETFDNIQELIKNCR